MVQMANEIEMGLILPKTAEFIVGCAVCVAIIVDAFHLCAAAFVMGHIFH